MLNKLKAKLKKQGGFTLIEMLIVVAIIAILIAISIPLVNGALEKARDSTDQANERSAKAITLLVFMGATEDKIEDAAGTGTYDYTPGTKIEASTKIYYDAKRGILTQKEPDAYGQCTGKTTCYNKGADGSHINQVIIVTIDEHGEFTPEWTDHS